MFFCYNLLWCLLYLMHHMHPLNPNFNKYSNKHFHCIIITFVTNVCKSIYIKVDNLAFSKKKKLDKLQKYQKITQIAKFIEWHLRGTSNLWEACQILSVKKKKEKKIWTFDIIKFRIFHWFHKFCLIPSSP